MAILGSVGVEVAKKSVDLASVGEAAAGLGDAALVVGGVVVAVVAKELLDGMFNEAAVYREGAVDKPQLRRRKSRNKGKHYDHKEA